jgi:hypothetical protein
MTPFPSLSPLGGASLVMLIDSMGDSLSVVNDARQSFDNRKEQWTEKGS